MSKEYRKKVPYSFEIDPVLLENIKYICKINNWKIGEYINELLSIALNSEYNKKLDTQN